MKVTEFKPVSPVLQNYISAYKLIEADYDVVNCVLPATSLAMSFRLTGNVTDVQGRNMQRLSFSTVSGMRKTARHIGYAPHTKNIVILFTETGAAPFFNEPLNILCNESVPLEHFIQTDQLNSLQDQLLSAGEPASQINIIESFLLSRFLQKHDPLVSAAVQEIKNSAGLIRVKDLCSRLYISQDAFEKRFRRIVGASPKHFANVVRMRTVVERCTTVADAVYGFNFHDASHFSREFKLFTGRTPAAFFSSPQFW